MSLHLLGFVEHIVRKIGFELGQRGVKEILVWNDYELEYKQKIASSTVGEENADISSELRMLSLYHLGVIYSWL